MKSGGKLIFIALFLIAAVITLSQINRFIASAVEPITSPLTGPVTPTNIPTPTDIPPVTSPIAPTETPMATPTATPIPTSTPIPTETPNPTLTATPTNTPSLTPTSTPTSAPTPTTASSPSGNGNSGSGNSGNGGGNGGGSSGSAPSCGDQKPGSAPTITSIRRTGNNQLTLTWAKAANPVSYYWVAYGTKPGSLEYGSGAIGNQNTTSFQVNALSAGRVYYFRVRAGNGCKPGEYSNEVGANTIGRIFVGPAAGFQQGVLGTSTKGKTAIVRPTGVVNTQLHPTNVPTDNAPANNTPNPSWFSQVTSFFGGFFGK